MIQFQKEMTNLTIYTFLHCQTVCVSFLEQSFWSSVQSTYYETYVLLVGGNNDYDGRKRESQA